MAAGSSWVRAARSKLRLCAVSGLAVAVLLLKLASAEAQDFRSADNAAADNSSSDTWLLFSPALDPEVPRRLVTDNSSTPDLRVSTSEPALTDPSQPAAVEPKQSLSRSGLQEAAQPNEPSSGTSTPGPSLFSGPIFETGWLRNVDATLIGIAGTVALSFLSGLLVIAGSAGRRVFLQKPTDKSRLAITEDQNDRQACLGLVEQAGALWRSAETAVLRLDEAAPIRRLLLNELRQVERLLSRDVNMQTMNRGALTARMSGDYWRILRQRLRRTIRDLERILATADAAIETLGDTGHEPRMPRTREEALLVLGASKGADVEVLNRLVRALRQCWHPDLAQTDADRVYRDARLAQINVAYDLLTGRRVEG